MKFRGVILVLGSVLLVAVVCAQNSGPEDLPSAPSAVQQQLSNPKPPPPANPAPAHAPAPTQPQTAAPSDAAAAKSEPSSPGTATGTKPGAASNSTSSSSQSQSQSRSDEGAATTTITKTVNEVNVVFTVTDRHGRYVKDLAKGDFSVLDDSKPADQIRSFHNETYMPLQVVLLVDASNSVRDRFKFEQEAAIEFLNQTVRPRYDRAFVVGFDVTPEVTQDFTDNTEALSRGVRMLRPGGGTAMYDALYYACRDKLLKSPQTGAVRRAIILVSDGDDNASHVSREEAIEMALRANAIVYTISTNFPSGGSGDKVLQRIADATGGRAFVPFQLTDVANAFGQIQNDLRSQYALSYRPADFKHDGRYRTIEILAQTHKGLKVRRRHGYYAPAE